MSVPFDRVENTMLKAVELAKPTVPNLLLNPKPSVEITELKASQVHYKLIFYVELGESSDGTARSTICKLLQRDFPAAGIAVGWSRSEVRNLEAVDSGNGKLG